MSIASLESIINSAWEDRASIDASTKGERRDAVEDALSRLDAGELRVAEKIPGKTGRESWQTHQWLKKAVLLSFRLNDMGPIEGGPGGATWWDKVDSKFLGMGKRPSPRRASAPCPMRSCGAPPSSPRASC